MFNLIPMHPSPDHSPLDWAKRVNSSWIVKGDLHNHADTWLDHLASLDDGRLERSCEIARAMCGIRNRLDDPKPWFYTGLFSLATADEARRFLNNHRITKAAIPGMAEDEDVKLWMDRIGPETHDLLIRLRESIAKVSQSRPA